MEQTILELRDQLDDEGKAGFEADLRIAFGLPADQRDRALERVIRSWESRRELQATPDTLPWLR